MNRTVRSAPGGPNPGLARDGDSGSGHEWVLRRTGPSRVVGCLRDVWECDGCGLRRTDDRPASSDPDPGTPPAAMLSCSKVLEAKAAEVMSE